MIKVSCCVKWICGSRNHFLFNATPIYPIFPHTKIFFCCLLQLVQIRLRRVKFLIKFVFPYLLFCVPNGFLKFPCIMECLKLVPAIFYQFLFLHQIITFENYEKWFLFHLNSSFRSRDIQIFVFPSSPLFLSAGRCFRGWSKINLKVYDVINHLNKNLIRDFVWYHQKEKRYDIEILSIL